MNKVVSGSAWNFGVTTVTVGVAGVWTQAAVVSRSNIHSYS